MSHYDSSILFKLQDGGAMNMYLCYSNTTKSDVYTIGLNSYISKTKIVTYVNNFEIHFLYLVLQ